jgi:beta-glucosidase-like glycosyl hydrolase
MGFFQFLIPRLDGHALESGLKRYLAMAREGAAGFIVFGGELNSVREGVQKLQKESATPLLICSDLEQGLGQQIKGGTLFPPAMAMGEASSTDIGLIREAFSRIAEEAAYAGINAILAPVLDLNTNPRNPIIATRAFGSDPERVSLLGAEMIKAFQARGIIACGKHFPGHGDTDIDSHISLPTVSKSLSELEACELVPFKGAIGSGAGMIMLGHLKVPALDPSGTPVSISTNAVKYLRKDMGFQGIVTTDAMDMGGLGGYGEEESALKALQAGVDVLLHPNDPVRLASELVNHASEFDADRLLDFRKALMPRPADDLPPFDNSVVLRLTEKAIRIKGRVNGLKKPFVLVLNDEKEEKGETFFSALKREFPSARGQIIRSALQPEALPAGRDIIVAVFSSVRAYKGGASTWVKQSLSVLKDRAHALVSFGSPWLIDIPDTEAARIFAYWDSPHAQEAAAQRLLDEAKRA